MPLTVSIDNMAAEVRRELGFRDRVYKRWVQQGKIRPETAAGQIERLQAVLEALEELRLARGFFAIACTVGIDLPALEKGQLSFMCPGTARQLLKAMQDWAAPRYAPLTMGTQVGAMPKEPLV